MRRLIAVLLIFGVALSQTLNALAQSTPGPSADEIKSIFSESVYYDSNSTSCGSVPGGVDSSGGGNTIYLMGDSWLRGLNNAKIVESLTASGYTVTKSNAVGGRSLTGKGGSQGATPQSGLEALDADASQIAAASKVVIILGTNPDNYDRQIPNALSKLSGKNIYWVNTSANRTDLVGSFNKANEAIQKHSQEGAKYKVIDWFSKVYPGGNPLDVDPNARSPLMSSDRIHPSGTGNKELIKLIQESVGAPSATSGGSALAGATKDSLPEIAKSRLSNFETKVAASLPIYQTLSTKHGIPWQIFGALHFVEAGSAADRSMLGGEKLGTKAVDSENTPKTLEESGDIAFDFLKSLADAVYNVTVDGDMTFDELSKAFLGYHRGFLYARVPASEGGPWLPNISPYVMNLYDANHTGPDGKGMLLPMGTSGVNRGYLADGKKWGETIDPGVRYMPGAMTYLAYFGLTPAGSNFGTTCSDGKNILNPGQLLWPVKDGGSLSSCWQDFRHKTVSGGTYYHSGLDIGGPIGSEIVSTMAGKVVFAGVHSSTGDLSRGYGNLIIVDHLNGRWSHYGHLSAIGVVVGQTVSQGEKIGEMGSTGVSTGSHLHFNWYDKWPWGTLPNGAGMDDGNLTLNPLTNGLAIPSTVRNEAHCEQWPTGGREVYIAI